MVERSRQLDIENPGLEDAIKKQKIKIRGYLEAFETRIASGVVLSDEDMKTYNTIKDELSNECDLETKK